MVNNDKGNHHVNGKSLPRKRNGFDPNLKCPFKFNISWDKSGYFVVLPGRSGDPCHKHHPQHFDPTNVPLSTKLLTENQVESVNNIIKSTWNTSNGSNFLFSEFRQYISHVKLSFLHRNHSSVGPKIDAADDITRMLSNF